MNRIGLRLVCLLIGYLFGCLQWSYLIGKSKGIDIRTKGSGNAGTTNAARVMGKKVGLLVLVLDFGKSLICLLLVGWLFGKSYPDMVYLLKMYAFAGVVLGHDFPFYMNFKGGKGAAALAGFVFGFHISLLPFGVISFFVPLLITNYVSVGSICVYCTTCIVVMIEACTGLYHLGSSAYIVELCVIMVLLTALAIWQHRGNIDRLRHGTERKTYLFSHKDEGEKHEIHSDKG